jgi:hypothetical protein
MLARQRSEGIKCGKWRQFLTRGFVAKASLKKLRKDQDLRSLRQRRFSHLKRSAEIFLGSAKLNMKLDAGCKHSKRGPFHDILI